ncbi:hypothetical protein SAMN05216326_12713 [Nitrosomonas marina]|uniref:Uncharacterized protein n=1 Tax=Nitrosomonas marina TaxID=917 RepID=A0A1I0EFN4_9PROT|nr:hypothetical protein SAMN05216326_12713 [Nitrosomonas marina]
MILIIHLIYLSYYGFCDKSLFAEYHLPVNAAQSEEENI